MKKYKKKNILHIKKKKYFKIRHKKEKKNYFSFFVIKIFISLILFIILGLFEFLNTSSDFNNSDIKIIESKEYENFNKIKNKITDPLFKTLIKEISIIKHIYTDKTNFFKKGKNIIYITIGINNNKDYKYIMYVSMLSLLFNCNKKKSFIVYHILCSPDFNESSIEVFKPLLRNYSQNVEMIFYNMGNLFENQKINKKPPEKFYRLITPLFIDSDRIIHLDGDTIILSDLYEMYKLNFDDNYVLGSYDVIPNALDYLGINSTKYINSGVILLNLKKINKDNKTKEIIDLIAKNDFELRNLDQTVINYLFYPKIGRLPSKYGLFNFWDKKDLILYNNIIRTKIPIAELEEAFDNPGVIHFVLCWPKAWLTTSVYRNIYSHCQEKHDCRCRKYFDLWHFYAKKTEYYEQIRSFTGVKRNIY